MQYVLSEPLDEAVCITPVEVLAFLLADECLHRGVWGHSDEG
jgi:hypothetical protein